MIDKTENNDNKTCENHERTGETEMTDENNNNNNNVNRTCESDGHTVEAEHEWNIVTHDWEQWREYLPQQFPDIILAWYN